jgi:hypothetical protein
MMLPGRAVISLSQEIFAPPVRSSPQSALGKTKVFSWRRVSSFTNLCLHLVTGKLSSGPLRSCGNPVVREPPICDPPRSTSSRRTVLVNEVKGQRTVLGCPGMVCRSAGRSKGSYHEIRVAPPRPAERAGRRRFGERTPAAEACIPETGLGGT